MGRAALSGVGTCAEGTSADVHVAVGRNLLEEMIGTGRRYPVKTIETPEEVPWGDSDVRRRGNRSVEEHFLGAQDERRVDVWLVGAGGRGRLGGGGWVRSLRPGRSRSGRLAVGGVGGSLLVGHLLEGVPRGTWKTKTDALRFASQDAVGRGRVSTGPRGRMGSVWAPAPQATAGWWWAGGRRRGGRVGDGNRLSGGGVPYRLGGGRGFGGSRVGRWPPLRGGAAAARGW